MDAKSIEADLRAGGAYESAALFPKWLRRERVEARKPHLLAALRLSDKLDQIRELLLEARADDWYFDQAASKELLLIEEIVFTDTEATRRNGIHK